MEKPWESEPNEHFFKAHGLNCMILRNSHGALCGYVGVAGGHPLFKAKYNEPAECLRFLVKNRLNQSEAKIGMLELAMAALGGPKNTPAFIFNVHGSLTFSGGLAETWHPEFKGLWFFGFDCGHAGDLKPAYIERGWVDPDDVYRDFAYVQKEVFSLAEQLSLLEDVIAKAKTAWPEHMRKENPNETKS